VSNRRRYVLPSLLAAFGALTALTANAPSAYAAGPAAKIDSTVLRAARTGIRSVGTLKRDLDHAPVVIRLKAPATPAVLAKLAGAGAELELDRGTPLYFDRHVPAHVSEKAAFAVAALPEVERVALAPTDRAQPIAHSSELMRLADARGARPALDLLTGTGVLVGDSDSLVDVFHPAMFRADAGYFSWIDVDHDGHFTPGVDAIDLDGDGAAGEGETAMPLTAATYDWYGSVDARGAVFDPGVDWLYLDTNGSGARDYGAAAGFDDATPAFGEPLFVPDDLDRNGKLDPGEKVVRLGTSKYRAVRVKVVYDKTKVNQVYTRGTNLSQTPVDLTHGTLYGFPDAYHATGVTSIIAGDVPLAGRRWVGIAPDVELVESFDVESTGEQLPTTSTTWLLAQKPDVMLYELAPWTGLALDGSDALSKIIDDSTTKNGVVHTCPTGDQAGARKHAHVALAAGASSELAFDLPAHAKARTAPLTYVDLTAHVRDGDVASLTVTSPTGDTFAVVDAASGALTGGGNYYVSLQTTDRGTHMYDVLLYLQGGSSTDALAVGTWKLAVKGGAGAATIDAYISDDQSSWALGAAWDAKIATDVSTIGVPSVADHCIAVGAMPDHVTDSAAPWFTMSYYDYDVPATFVETQLQVRAYSPRGPRIDGVQKPDVLAPDNPWAAAPHTTQDTYKFPYGSFAVFGGTSGASPHVTGLGALLAQSGVHGDAARDAIRKGATKGDGTAALPNGDYGYGALSAAGAFGVPSTAAVTPTIEVKLDPATPAVGANATLTPVVAGGDGLEVKWDDDYDGTWDVAYAKPSARAVTLDHVGERSFKVRVRNASGHFSEALAVVHFVTPPPAAASSGCGCVTAGREGSTRAAGIGSALALAALAVVRRRRR
jgi:hypothetical protein